MLAAAHAIGGYLMYRRYDVIITERLVGRVWRRPIVATCTTP